MFVSPLCVTQWRSLPRREVGNLSSVSQRTSCLQISKIVRENFIESYFSARNLGLVMHLDCFKCNHHQWKLSNKLHEPNDFYCLKKYNHFYYILTFSLPHWGWLGRRASCLRGWGMETGAGPAPGQEPRLHWPHPDIIMTMTIYNEFKPLLCNSTNSCEKKNHINF